MFTTANESVFFTDTSGNFIKVKYYDIYDFQCADTAAGGFVLGAINYGSSPYGSVTRIDTAGNVLWSRRIDAPNGTNSGVTSIKSLSNGSFIAMLGMAGGISGPSAMLKLDAAGNTVWCKYIQYMSNTLSFECTADNGFLIAGGNNVLVKTDTTGLSNGCTSLVPNYPNVVVSPTVIPVPAGLDSIIPQVIANVTFFSMPVALQTLTNCLFVGAGIEINNTADNIQLYPNPAHSVVTLLYTGTGIFFSVTVNDVLGNTVIAQTHKGSERVAVNVAALAAGVYFVKVESDGMSEVKKLVKQ